MARPTGFKVAPEQHQDIIRALGQMPFFPLATSATSKPKNADELVHALEEFAVVLQRHAVQYEQMTAENRHMTLERNAVRSFFGVSTL